MVNRKLEIAWTLAVVALLAGIAVWSTFILYKVDALPSDPSEYVVVRAEQWSWTFCYSNQTCFTSNYDAATNTVSGGELWVLPGTVVQLNVTSLDVDHSLYIPGLGVQTNALPGRTNRVAFQIPNAPAGTTYEIFCTEFCGQGHATMRSFVDVL